MVGAVVLQVLVEVVDAIGQQCDLHLRGTGVAFVLGIGRDDFGLGHGIHPPFVFCAFAQAGSIAVCEAAVGVIERPRCGSKNPRISFYQNLLLL